MPRISDAQARLLKKIQADRFYVPSGRERMSVRVIWPRLYRSPKAFKAFAGKILTPAGKQALEEWEARQKTTNRASARHF